MAIRDPSCLPPSRLPPVAAPATVSEPHDDDQQNKLSLDEAIRIALANSEVIRVLGGSSGQTQYDPAIINTEIDQTRAAFDPTLDIDNQFRSRKPPGARSSTRTTRPRRLDRRRRGPRTTTWAWA